MYFSPPDHPKCPGFGLGFRRIFRAKYPFFGVAVLGNEYPVLENEYQKNAGTSRVKSPPDHLKCPGFGLGLTAIFLPKYPFFGVASLGSETRSLVSETRERPGISRVNKWHYFHQPSFYDIYIHTHM